jgi:hypothetical protein
MYAIHRINTVAGQGRGKKEKSLATRSLSLCSPPTGFRTSDSEINRKWHAL